MTHQMTRRSVAKGLAVSAAARAGMTRRHLFRSRRHCPILEYWATPQKCGFAEHQVRSMWQSMQPALAVCALM